MGEWRSEKLAFSRRFLVVVEVCLMGSVAWQEEVGIAWVWVMAVPFLRYLVLLFSYCLKQFVYILIKRNESHSERVCFVVISGVVFGVFVAGCWSLVRCLTDIRSDMAKRQLLRPNQGKALTFH
uniref:hypothetical protein n=1 Tax=Klebsiella pneumoniae TaxID=573 RepID=UPI0039C8F4DC